VAELIDADGTCYPLAGAGPWRLGRRSDNDIAFTDDQKCSREQCILSRHNGVFYLLPVSENVPTYLDDALVEDRIAVPIRARISFGETVVHILADRDERSEEQISSLSGGVILGRAPGPGGIVVDHPSVSRRHAEFGLRQGKVWLRDLTSTNGTFVNGARITSVALNEGDVVTIGPDRFTLRDGALVRRRQSAQLAIQARGVAVDVGNGVRILQPCSLAIGSAEFVCLIGGSGAGKSTLMNVISGRRVASEGSVSILNFDVAREFESLKPLVSLVPQREALHDLLTVRKALGYIAELRLPADLSATDRAVEIEKAAEAVEMSEHLDKPFCKLSGGQKKRACLAAEVLCKPQVMFLDEITSGLDEQTDFEIMQLLAKIAKSGTTIVCITHNLANIVQFCDRVVIMGRGGHMVFNGAPNDALSFFGIDRLGAAFSKVNQEGASQVAARFLGAHRDQASQIEPVSPVSDASSRAGFVQNLLTGLSQFAILTRRNFALIRVDYPTLTLVFMQASIIGVLVGWAASDFGTNVYTVASSKKVLLTLLIMSAIWMGCNGSSKDIVAEANILRREKDVNLSLLAYLFARLFTGCVFVIAQITVMFVFVMLETAGIPGDDLSQYLLLAFTGCVAVMMGLMISAATKTEAQATAVVPMVLVPQLIFIGTIVPHMPKSLSDVTSYTIPTNVLNAAALAIFAREGKIPNLPMPKEKPFMETRALDDVFSIASLHFLILFLATYFILRWRYRRGAEA